METLAISSIGFSASFARVIVDYAVAQGIDSAPVLTALGLQDTALDSPQRVPSSQMSKALGVLARLCGDAHAGLRAAQLLRPAHLGALGYALAGSGGGEGIALFDRLQSLTCNEIHIHHSLDQGVIETRFEGLGPLPSDPAFWIFFVCARLGFARWVSGAELVPLRIDLPCRPPADPYPLQSFVKAPVRFNTPDCREVMPLEWLAFLNPNADPAVRGLMAAMAGQQWEADLDDGPSVIGQLKQHIGRQLGLGSVPTLDDVDAMPSSTLSARQVQRRLAKEGISFKELVEQVRRDQVLSQLRQTDLPLAEISKRAAYLETSSFHRAVRRWTGTTPMAVREQARNGQPSSN